MADDKSKEMSFEQVLQDPTAAFDRPRDVLGADRFTKDQKLEILKRWEYDAQRLQESAGEAMTGGESAPLDEVLECIHQLDSGKS